MKPNSKISAAVAAILWAPSTTIVFAAPADTAAATGTGGELQEVVVTAERRTENIQDVPITIQAISGEQLKQLNVTTFNDLLKYTPNVTSSGNGPGTGNIFMRGLGSAGSGNQSQSTTAPFPNVALYLDEQSMQFPARNNDVYLVDMERVEVLEGPQGTLFGGGAQAGAIRYITNKPKLDATEGNAAAGYGTTASGGDPNNNLSGVINLPLIADTLAVRAVIFSDHRGGYISNVPSTIGFLPGSVAATTGGNPTANNANQLGTNTNSVNVGGFRLSGLYKINDSWDLLLQQNYQDARTNGYFYTYPVDSNGTALGPNQLAAFTPAYNKDRYESTAWTVNGRFGDLKAVYTGSYMVRHIEGQQDYSNYVRSAVGSYYGCIGPGAGYFNTSGPPLKPPKYPVLVGKPLQCYAPIGNWHDTVQNQHTSHELRISTNEDRRIRGLFGAYWEKFVIDDEMNFNYLAVPQCNPANLTAALLPGGKDCLSAVGPLPGAFASDPSLRVNANTAFGEDAQRGYKQTAFFASIDFDLIPKVLTLTGGTRHYDYKEFEEGSQFSTESSSHLVVDHANGACTAAKACGFPINLSKSESGYRSRGNLTWHITPDIMTYYTFSQGFRPGGFNRTSSLPGQPPSLAGEAPFYGKADPRASASKQFNKPAGYDSDNLTNNELGFKSEFLSHRVLVNASAYKMKWNDVQLSLFDPVHLGNTTFDINGPSYTIKGVELQLVARVTDELTVQGSSSWNSSDQTNAPCLPSNRVSAGNPTPIGQCITQVNGVPYTNPYGVLNTSPPFSPPFMFNLRARYDWTSGAFRPFAWVGASHIAAMRNEPASFPDGNDPAQNPPTTTLLRYTIPGYTTYDGALGVAKDNWVAQITGSNLTNSDAVTNLSSGQFIKSAVPLRPRVLTFLFEYKF
jgi:iron complex outermembrane recepter protein